MTARRDYGATDGGALERAVDPADFLEHAAGPARGLLARAVAEARLQTVPCAAVVRTADRPYEAILEVARDEGCDLIFMASRGRRGCGAGRGWCSARRPARLARSPVPVLVSGMAARAEAWRRNPVVMAIHREHLSLAAVLNALREAVARIRTAGAAPDFALLEAMLRYIRDYPEKLHHPKEERYLFARLQSRTRELDAVVAELERQHRRELALVEDLRSALARYAAEGAPAFPAFAAAAEALAQAVWAHMRLEEQAVLPAAAEHLGPADVREIAAAFAANGDPCFDPEVAEGYDRLFAQIMNHAPAKALHDEGLPLGGCGNERQN